MTILELTTNILPVLHSDSVANLVWWSQNEITRWFSDAFKRLAQNYGLFVVRDVTAISLIQGEPLYDAPPRHLSTLHVAVGNRPLIADSTHALELRDADYQVTEAPVDEHVQRWYSDKVGANMIGFQPVPGVEDDGENAEVIFHQYPCYDEGDLNETIDVPLFIGDYLEAVVIGEAYSCESDAQCVEIGQAARALAGLYTEIFASYWKGAQ
jgi:hypothetical protein